jgi:protein-L-isoaspartate(D-aspartate) O-methyltransferase
VRAALLAVRRDAFVAPADAAEAWANRPLPIGHGQTISQPYIVALMTELLDLPSDAKVLEVGTGSGYQAAVLARLARHVWSVETVAELAMRAAAALDAEGVTNVSIREGDGTLGWVEHAPFDAIIVTAAAHTIPSALVAQLRPGGSMVIPIGRTNEVQRLTLIRKDSAGELEIRPVLDVAFVPLVGERGRL